MIETNKVYEGKMEEVLQNFPENCFDSIVTDPPYGLKFMGKKWDYEVPSIEQWKEAFRVLKPGGYMLVACGTRTQHRMVVNIEDAGFEIRDVITWHYGSGFPKSLDISKAIDKIMGAERVVIGKSNNHISETNNSKSTNTQTFGVYGNDKSITSPSTNEAKQWEGWGTALKPATEFWTLCRKPLSENTVAENVLKHGTGGINIDACRIKTDNNLNGGAYSKDGGRRTLAGDERDQKGAGMFAEGKTVDKEFEQPDGRFPANLILDDFMAAELDNQSGVLTSGAMKKSYEYKNNGYSLGAPSGSTNHFCESSEGGASRFFYVAKPSQYERNKGLKGKQKKAFAASNQAKAELKRGNQDFVNDSENSSSWSNVSMRENFHPTVKPIELMRYLVKMITTKGGICLDPFCGSGTTMIACKLELINYVGVEIDKDYCEIIDSRVKAWNPERYKEQTLF